MVSTTTYKDIIEKSFQILETYTLQEIKEFVDPYLKKKISIPSLSNLKTQKDTVSPPTWRTVGEAFEKLLQNEKQMFYNTETKSFEVDPNLPFIPISQEEPKTKEESKKKGKKKKKKITKISVKGPYVKKNSGSINSYNAKEMNIQINETSNND